MTSKNTPGNFKVNEIAVLIRSIHSTQFRQPALLHDAYNLLSVFSQVFPVLMLVQSFRLNEAFVT